MGSPRQPVVAAEKPTSPRRAGSEEAHEWTSNGEGDFEVKPCDKATRGTEVILKVREDDKEFLEPARLSRRESPVGQRGGPGLG